jgi:hypothetical protein
MIPIKHGSQTTDIATHLQVHLRVPVAVHEHNDIGGLQVQTHAARTRAEEHEAAVGGGVEAWCSGVRR